MQTIERTHKQFDRLATSMATIFRFTTMHRSASLEMLRRANYAKYLQIMELSQIDQNDSEFSLAMLNAGLAYITVDGSIKMTVEGELVDEEVAGKFKSFSLRAGSKIVKDMASHFITDEAWQKPEPPVLKEFSNEQLVKFQQLVMEYIKEIEKPIHEFYMGLLDSEEDAEGGVKYYLNTPGIGAFDHLQVLAESCKEGISKKVEW